MKLCYSAIFVSLLLVCAVSGAGAQNSPAPGPVAKLSDLLAEAGKNNPQIQSAEQNWRSARQVPSQVSTLPDPEVMIQQVNVGSPRPFAGYSNSEMADIGLGFSQDIPFPGKLRLRGQIAQKEADVQQQAYESVRRSILALVETDYYELSFLATKLSILHGDGQLLAEVEKSAEARYRSGLATQQDVLQAQLQQTQLLREIATTQLQSDVAQARLKKLLNRSQSSPDVLVAKLNDTPVRYDYSQLLEAAANSNPGIAGTQDMVGKSGLEVDLAHKDFDPDFNVTYMWLRTDPFEYRAHYELTFGMRLPIYRGRRQQKELAKAEADRERAQDELAAEKQNVAAELREYYAAETRSSDLLKIYREGLRPQAQAEFQAGLAAYQSDREDFQALLASFLDVLKADEGYWQTLSERETAVARIEEITGLSLHQISASEEKR
jgi:cobalt-zinc-cadmium efflux system outer membrane protein